MIWAFIIPGIIFYFLLMGISYLANIPPAFPHLRKYRVVKEEIEDEVGWFIEVLTVFGWRYLRAPEDRWSTMELDIPFDFKSYEKALEKIALLRINKRTILPDKYKFSNTTETTARVVEERRLNG